MSKERPVAHEFEGENLESAFIGRRDGQTRPTVILVPTVMVSLCSPAVAASMSRE